MSRSITVAGAVLGSVLALAASASAKDYAGTALNIIPSGQYGGVPVPPGADSRPRCTTALTPLFDQVTPDDLTDVLQVRALRRRAARARAATRRSRARA